MINTKKMQVKTNAQYMRRFFRTHIVSECDKNILIL